MCRVYALVFHKAYEAVRLNSVYMRVCAWTCVKFTLEHTNKNAMCVNTEYWIWWSTIKGNKLFIKSLIFSSSIDDVKSRCVDCVYAQKKKDWFVPFTFVCKIFAELWAECWVVASSSSSSYCSFKKYCCCRMCWTGRFALVVDIFSIRGEAQSK